jgi:DNA-binding XRE family transcriptional regulator
MASKEINWELNKTIGIKLQRVRMRAFVKQNSIADVMNVSNTTYSKHEHGKVDFTVTKLKQIADFFQVCLMDFLDDRIETPRLLKEMTSENDYKVMEAKYSLYKELYEAEKSQNQKVR